MGVDPATGIKTDVKAPASVMFPRHEQTFPALTAAEIARMRRFGDARH
jgi:thioredoxin reductase (NADPH)